MKSSQRKKSVIKFSEGLPKLDGDRGDLANWHKFLQSEKERIYKVRKERVVREILGSPKFDRVLDRNMIRKEDAG